MQCCLLQQVKEVSARQTERGIVGGGETLVGSPQDGWADVGGANESHVSERDRHPRLGAIVRPERKRHLELTMGDSDLERLLARYQPESFNGEDTVWRDWSRVFRTWTGRFQRGVQEIIRSVEVRPGTTVAELDIRLEDWRSAELKSVAVDFCHALILFFKGKTLKNVLTNKEREGFVVW